MNLKKSLSLISIGLFLPIFIAPLVQGQVTIELTPITYPIVLPDSGGSFDYLLTVTNQGSAITATVWCMVTLPNGSSWGPVVGPATRTLAAGQTQSYYRSQIIPQRAPCGYYLMRAYVGIYPDTIWAQDQFEFQHQAVRGTEQEWVARYNGPANSGDEAHSITLDNDGNIYVTGWGINSGIHSDYATVKYDANGNQIWAALYNGPANNEDKACALAVDGSRNVYVTGYSYGRGSNYDYVTVKYDSSGNQIWVARFNGPANGEDKAIALAVDGGGHVYVTGRSLGIGTFEDYTTIQYDASGNQIWVACYGHSGWDAAYALEVDGTGNIYVTGSSNGGATFLDYATVKYDASGNQIWVARYNGPGNYSDDYAFALAVDGVGNVYVTGESPGRGTDYDYATVKYNSSGNELWVTRYNGPSNDADVASALAVDNGGRVYVTGYSIGIGTNWDFTTIKYNSAGAEQWVTRFDANGCDVARALVVDGGGNVYVTGESPGRGSDYDYATVKYDTAGNELWTAHYNGPGNWNDFAYALAMDGGGNVYVTGMSAGSGTSNDCCTIKYSGGDIANWMPVEATVFGQPLPQECRLEGNYPNPFNASTVLRYELRASSHVSLKIYDTAGRLVGTLVNGWRSAGEHELTWEASDLPSGMYFARFEAGGHAVVQKMMLLK